jgi:hypothetical protein
VLLQGILSSFFYKFADTILKKYSSTIATIFTALLSWAMFHHPLTMNFAIGVSIVFVSMHQFFTFGDKPKDKEHGKSMMYSPSMEHIRVAENGTYGKFSDDGRSQTSEKVPLLPR